MKLSEMKQAIDEANSELRRADMVVADMLRMCAGRLRTIHGWSDARILVGLKRELRAFNATTRRWDDQV